jgi:hypothetical protein
MKNRILFLLLLCTPFSANTQSSKEQPPVPNLYQLQGADLQVTYNTTGRTGKPHFTYKDASQTLSFTGDQIRKTQTEIGTLVTVTIHMTVDTGSTSFTLLVPTVNLASESQPPAEIHTVGITTIHRFSVVPAGRLGQTETYAVTQLSGTATLVWF